MNDTFANRYTYEVLSRYLYNKATPPINLIDEKLIRDLGAQSTDMVIDAH